MSFGLFLDDPTGSGVTDDEETTAASGPDEAVRAGAVMKHLIHGSRPVLPKPVLEDPLPCTFCMSP